MGRHDALRNGYTVAKITGISGTTVTLDTPVTATAGTNILPVELYTLAYSNIGGASGQNVTVTDQLPANLLFGGIVSNGVTTRTDSTAIGSTGLLSWSVGTLSNGGSGTIQFLAFPSTPGVYKNVAVIADGSALNDRNAWDNATTHTAHVTTERFKKNQATTGNMIAKRNVRTFSSVAMLSP